MTRCVLIPVLLLLCLWGSAQTDDRILSDTQRIPNFLIGFETNIHFQDVQSGQSDFRYSGIGFQIEKPYKQFSFGTAIIRQNFSGHRFYESTGYVKPETNSNRTRYGYNSNVQQIRLINIPLRIQYRLPPCNCAYVQGAVLSNILMTKSLYKENDVLLIDEPTNDIFALEDILPFSLGYELAIGFNMHASDFVKIIGRFAYTHYGLVDSRVQQFKRLNNTYLTFNLGLQYAFYKNKRTKT